jgi:hypothetical protein
MAEASRSGAHGLRLTCSACAAPEIAARKQVRFAGMGLAPRRPVSPHRAIPVILAAAAAALVLRAPISRAADVSGVRFADRVTLDTGSLVLNGVGVRRATVFKVRVYAAGLYVRETTREASEVLRADRPKYLVAVMLRDVSRQDSVPVFREGIQRSAGSDAAAIRAESVAFEGWIPSMREGQSLSVAFSPESGVLVRSTAKAEAFRGSARFGTALFGVWVGPHAADADLRAGLLRGPPTTASRF